MGLPLRRPLPVGRQRRRHRPGRVQPAGRRPGRRHATPTASSWSSATTAGCRWAPAPCGSKATTAGSRRATAASWCSVRRRCWPAGRSPRSAAIPATFHVRDFLELRQDAQRNRRATPTSACYSHIACHAANIAIFLNRKLQYDPAKNEFLGDDQANRLRSEALREPWRICKPHVRETLPRT